MGAIKHYAATDHLDSPAYQSLTRDDLLGVTAIGDPLAGGTAT